MSSESAPYLSTSARYGNCEHVSPIDTGDDARWLGILHDISVLILRSTDLRAALPDIMQQVRECLGLQIISLSFDDQVWLVPADDGKNLSPATSTHTVASQGTSGSTAVDEHELLPARILHFGSDEMPTRYGAPARVPIHARGKAIGFMLVRTDRHSRLDAGSIELLEKIGDTLAEAVARERQSSDLAANENPVVNVRQLLDIVSHLATLTTVDAAIEPLLVDIAELLNADTVSLVTPGSLRPRLFSSIDGPAPGELRRLTSAAVVRLAVHRGQMQVGNIARDSHRPAESTHAVAIPLLTSDEPVGVLVLERVRGDTFSFEERETGIIIARHLAFSLERERRVRAYSRQNLLLSLVERVTAFIARSTDADDLPGRMAREIRRTFGYDCSIAMISGNRLVIHAIELGGPHLIPEWINEGIPLETGIMGRVARTGQPAFVRDVRTDPSYLDTGRNTLTEIAVPIRIGDQVVGVLNVESDGDNPLQNLDFEILLILANHIGIALTNRKLIASERESRVAIEAIQRVSTIVAETLDPDESLRRIAATLADVLGYPVVTLALLEGQHLIRRASYGYEPDSMPEVITIQEGISGRVVRTGQPVLLEDTRTDPDYLGLRSDLTSEVCVPIRCNGEIVGILNVEGTQERPVTYRDLHLLTTFAEHAGVLLNNAQAYAALSREATLDPMTGVPNLRYFQQELHERIDHARRDGQQLSLAVIDVDNLKEANDTHGHLVGDQLLQELARRMLGQLRGHDLLARYAGDEFVAILPDVGEEGALEIGRRLLEAARERPFEIDDASIHLSLSVGVATFPQDAVESTDLLRAADMAMYVAKESGKNRVSSARQSEHIRRRPKS